MVNSLRNSREKAIMMFCDCVSEILKVRSQVV